MTRDSRSKTASGEPPTASPRLVPPDARADEQRRPSRRGPMLTLLCGLALLIAALLVFFLPLQEQRPGSASSPASSAEPQSSRPAGDQAPLQTQTAAQADAAREVNRLIGLWLQEQAQAEANNISAWGGEAYGEAVSLAEECDRLLGEQDYLAARTACAGAIDKLDELMAAKTLWLEESIAAGQQALERGDPQAAVVHFRRALSIDADDERVEAGLGRAEQLPAVLNLVKEGQAMEQAGDFAGAWRALSQAVALDAQYLPAHQALDNLGAKIAERDYRLAMSSALQAMAAGKLSAASSALQQAESIRPDDRAVADLKQQLARTRLSGRLAALRQETELLQQEERWAEALKSCEQALGLDPHAAFAVSCRERTSSRNELDHRLKSILAKPERLFEDGPLQQARQALDHASAVTPRGPILAAQVDQLGQLIRQAEVEVEVVIRSDGLTEVVIYHVGRLGLFQEKTLVLRTGDYTATGSRNGYHDVRQTLKVRPSSGKLVFTLRCEEPI